MGIEVVESVAGVSQESDSAGAYCHLDSHVQGEGGQVGTIWLQVEAGEYYAQPQCPVLHHRVPGPCLSELHIVVEFGKSPQHADFDARPPYCVSDCKKSR